MHIYNKKYLLLLLPISLLACRKYVENVPIQGQRVIEYTEDYRMLMNNPDLLKNAFGALNVLSSDDLDFTETAVQNTIKANVLQKAVYTWSRPFYTAENADNDWNALYSGIYVFNTVIRDVMNSKGGTNEVKGNILGEALVHRSFSYFMLANLYGKQYEAATAAQDPAVPMLLEPKLFEDLTRTPVEKVYGQIIADTKRAIPILPVTQPINFRPNKASAYALLAKVYLFMRDFKNASLYADSTLMLSNELYNFNTSLTKYPSQFNNKQVLLRKAPRSPQNIQQLSGSLLNLLGTKDLRYTIFVRPGTAFFPSYTGFGYWSPQNYNGAPDGPDAGLTVNETWLIKAECLARTGQGQEGLKLLNDFRKFRFKPDDYSLLSAANDDDVLRLIINERRLEFFGSGMRWFDQRRLDKDAMFAQTYTRVYDNVTYTLAPHSNRFVFPIAQLVISQNPEITKNPD